MEEAIRLLKELKLDCDDEIVTELAKNLSTSDMEYLRSPDGRTRQVFTLMANLEEARKDASRLIFFNREGLPRLASQSHGATSPHDEDKAHGYEPAEALERKFLSYTSLDKKFEFGRCGIPRSVLTGTPLMQWSNEGSLHNQVDLIVREIVKAMGLEAQLRVISDNRLDSKHIPDVTVLVLRDVPICVIEVKKPVVDVTAAAAQEFFQDTGSAGQIRSYLTVLQARSGQKQVYGILTDYVHWRPFWLHGATTKAAAAPPSLDALQNPSYFERQSGDLEKVRTELLEGKECSITLKKTTAPPRGFYAGETVCAYSLDENDSSLQKTLEVTKLVASVIAKALVSPRNLPLFTNSRMYRMRSFEFSGYHVFPEDTAVKLRSGMIQSNTVMLLAHLGGGLDGEAYLVCSEYGICCVLKLLYVTSFTYKNIPAAQSAAVNEAGRWKTLWGIDARSVKLGDDFGVLAPLVRMLPKDEVVQRRAEVDIVIKSIADKGAEHLDVHWRHVGKYKEKIIFIDLTSVKSSEDKNASYAAMKKQMDESLTVEGDESRKAKKDALRLSEKKENNLETIGNSNNEVKKEENDLKEE